MVGGTEWGRGAKSEKEKENTSREMSVSSAEEISMEPVTAVHAEGSEAKAARELMISTPTAHER